MKPSRPPLSPILLALAAAATIAPAQAQQSPEVAALAKPDTASVSAGIVVGSGTEKDRTIFGQYNGLRKDDVNWLLDLDLVNRDDATGLWTTIRGRNLGLDSRELGLTVQR